jgi:hypothetical protein
MEDMEMGLMIFDDMKCGEMWINIMINVEKCG